MLCVVRRQVLDEDERHPAVGRHRVEELAERLQPARAGPDADDRKRQPRRLLVIHRLRLAVRLSRRLLAHRVRLQGGLFRLLLLYGFLCQNVTF